MNLGTFPTGLSPSGVAFDGTNIWVANNIDGSVTKLRARDGASLGTFPTGHGPRKVVFNGSSIWVANAFSNTTRFRMRWWCTEVLADPAFKHVSIDIS